jgi:uncharacterized RDD family membrane protein YckC
MISDNPGRAIRESISTRIYFGLIAFMITVKVVFILFPTVFPGADQEGAFSWTTILAIAVMGVYRLYPCTQNGLS